MLSKPTGLWRNPDFMKLWMGETVSLFGSQVTILALPLAAALTLQATAAQMGLLAAASTLPTLILGLAAGVWIDRHRRRPMLIVANLGRAVCLSLVPLAAMLGVLTMELLYLVALVSGLLTLFFDVAYVSYLPALVAPAQLVEGNSKLQVSQSAAHAAGPGLAGVLVQWAGAPLAIAVDALSFVCAALSLLLIPDREALPVAHAPEHSWRSELGDGLRILMNDTLLRPLVVWGGCFNLCSATINAVYLLYVVRELGISADLLGLLFAIGGIGGILGSFQATRAVQWLGLGRALIVSALVVSASRLLVPAATGRSALTYALLIGAGFTASFAIAMLGIHIVSIQQAVAPQHMLGRVTAAGRVIIIGILPLGSLLGGTLGELIGVRATLVAGALGAMLSLLWLWRSPVRTIHQPPAAGTPVAPV